LIGEIERFDALGGTFLMLHGLLLDMRVMEADYLAQDSKTYYMLFRGVGQIRGEYGTSGRL
jgi:hypothetical protein